MDCQSINYDETIQKWRKEKEEGLRGERSWLALEGLFWLDPGTNSFGTGENNQILLSQGPVVAGDFILSGDTVFLDAKLSSGLTYSGKPVGNMELQPDRSGKPTIFSLESLDMMVIQRGDRFGIRVWNKERPERVNFPGRQWYPVNKEYCLEADFTPAAKTTPIFLPDVTGNEQEMRPAGLLAFSIEGKQHNLLAIDEGDGLLFVIFRDLTSGVTTYPAGRYLYTNSDQNGKVILDFNQAYNPPCAFTVFATCPLPPSQNHLDLPIEAGEKFTMPKNE